MYPLNHQDPIRVTARGSLEGIDGDPTPSLDRHRTASYRLSCISEHQKENTRSSEDEYFPSPAQAIKTPSLEPVRWPHRHHHGNGKSQSSGDGSTVSPLQLDPEQIEGFRARETHYRHHLVLSTWRCAAPASVQPESQLLQEQEYEALRTQQPVRAPVSAPGLASPGIFEVQWQMIRWSDFQPRHLYVNGNEHATSGMGLDGRQSSTSGNSPLHSPIDVSSPPLASLPLSNCLPCMPRRLQLDTPGSIDWENSWPKRKPRKRHDVSESSNLDPSASKPVDSPANDARSSMTASLQREETEDQAKFHNTQESALKSCPELYRRSFSAVRPNISRFAPGKVSGLKSPNYSRFDSGRHQHRHHIHETVSKRFHSFRDRLRRGRSSSMFSVRPEFPPPPAGTVRRYQSRNSNEIWPSSEESPIFNTPESNISPVQPVGQNTVLLAASGLRIAAVELDRLTTQSRSAKSSLELARISSGTSSARSSSGSSDADTVPVVPASSPALLLPPAGLVNPISRLPRGAGRLSRRQYSRLSEVTTPEEINNPSQDAFPGFEAEPCESSMPQPPSSRRLASSDDVLSNMAPLLGLAPKVTQSPLDSSSALDVTVRSGIRLPGWPSPSGRNLEPLCGQTNTSDEGYANKNNLDPRLSTLRSPAIHTRSEPNYQLSREIGMETVDIVARDSALLADVMEQLKFTESQAGLREFEPRPCHPNTWTPDQGEPGDSEPFCPPNCLYAARCGHESEP
ncbi:hypothetical protein F5X98DRAFT_96946 [Xylaria grammica]|nr:hypothetical protein F5X98DRAFT_96946 [Xylaria grammica]